MKMIVAVALALAAVAAAIPVEQPVAEILATKDDRTAEGYSFGFKSSDDIRRLENGELRVILNEKNEPQTVVVVKGFYSYVDKEGNTERIEYSADENGYVASGPSIPKN